MTLEAAGRTPTITCFGDSLTAGTGGTALATLLGRLLPNRLVNNAGIGGQTAAQIAARQGGLPVDVTLSGNAFAGAGAVSVTAISTELLSAPSENNTRYGSGTIGPLQCFLIRTATGGPPSTSETYTITPAYSSTGAVPAKTRFVPDSAANARHDIQVIWIGRNNVGGTISTVPGLVEDMVEYMATPKRAVVVGVLAGTTETIGSGSTRTNLDAANAELEETWGDAFVTADPPTVDEMTAVGYTPSGADNTQIANGVWPDGLRSDSSGNRVHLTTQGYQIFANRIAAVINAKEW